MLILALVLLVLWFVLKVSILFWLFLLAVIVGVALMVAGAVGSGVGGRKNWY